LEELRKAAQTTGLQGIESFNVLSNQDFQIPSEQYLKNFKNFISELMAKYISVKQVFSEMSKSQDECRELRIQLEELKALIKLAGEKLHFYSQVRKKWLFHCFPFFTVLF
jgi:hypothetical protein